MTTKEQQQEPATVVIAGGGIVGLVLAMALKKQLGIVPEIYEKAHTFAPEVGAGLGMYPNGLRVLQDISPELLADVRAAGYPYMYRRWERHDGTEVEKAEESVLSDGDKDLDSLGIRRSRLQDVLVRHTLAQGIPIFFSKATVTAKNRNDGLIEVYFADGTNRLTQVLFGADGGKSNVRDVVAGEDAPSLSYTGVTCLMGLAECPPEEKGICFPSSDEDDFHGVFFPTGEREQCFQFHFPVKEQDANQLNWGNLSNEVGKEECLKLAETLQSKGWHEKYLEPLRNVTHAVRVGFCLLEPRLTTWSRGRIALVGDSAHPPVPYVGQGAQQGLEDAGVVVTLLKMLCLNEGGKFATANFEKAMKIYQDIRIKRSSEILDFSKSLGAMQANRARSANDGNVSAIEHMLKGEVLMYGTLPVMMPGADHDYKEDVRVATEETPDEDKVSDEEAQAALECMFGLDELPPPSCKVSPEEAYDAWMTLMNGCAY